MVSTSKGRSGHSTRYLHLISRNHCNTLLLINLQKPKTSPKETAAAKAICSDIRILTVQTDFCPLHVSPSSGTMSRRQINFYRSLLYKLFRGILVDRKKLGDSFL